MQRLLKFQHESVAMALTMTIVLSPSPKTVYPKLPQRRRNNNISAYSKSTKWLFTLFFFSEEELAAPSPSVAILTLPVALPLFIDFDGGEARI